ncbi:hypothetical protein STRDD13_01496 [Streptococcus sp. DD13]|nr:hypothetical protein STRDD13_01496 [Streptococcus sp. DD13]
MGQKSVIRSKSISSRHLRTVLSRAVKADEISLVEPAQPLRLARQSKNN